MEGFDGAKGPGVGLPVEIAEGKAGDKAWGEEFVDVVRVEIVDWKRGRTCQLRAKGAEE